MDNDLLKLFPDSPDEPSNSVRQNTDKSFYTICKLCLSPVIWNTYQLHFNNSSIALSVNKQHYHKINDVYNTYRCNPDAAYYFRLFLDCFVPPWMSERRPDGNLLLISCQLTSDDEAIFLQWR